MTDTSVKKRFDLKYVQFFYFSILLKDILLLKSQNEILIKNIDSSCDDRFLIIVQITSSSVLRSREDVKEHRSCETLHTMVLGIFSNLINGFVINESKYVELDIFLLKIVLKTKKNGAFQ